MSDDIHVVVMAGGSGTRFWPASRGQRPKQFLSIAGEGSLLRQTLLRTLPIVPWSRHWVVTARAHAEHVRREVPELPAENVLVEPVGRNTAPCIGWATRAVRARAGRARLAVVPADHYIPDPADFRAQLGGALEAARASRIVLLGLVPTRPETGYGYIELGPRVETHAGRAVHDVARFVEKPDHARAMVYLAGGQHLWNSGIFVFEADVMDAAIRAELPALADGLDALEREPHALDALYPTLPSISIDYAVMERRADIRVLRANFAWSDVGSWDAAYAEGTKDAAQNVVHGDVLTHAVETSLIEARAGRLVAVVGLSDVVVVDTPDAVLVARRGAAQDVKNIVAQLERAGRRELL